MSVPSIFKIFARSPVSPIEQHIHKVFASAEQLLPFFEAVTSENRQRANTLQEKIATLEHQADMLKKELRTHLSQHLFLSIPRSDILELLYRQDNIANKAKDIAGVVRGRNMQIPQQLQPTFLQFVKLSIATVKQADNAVNELHDLVETGFRGKEIDILTEMIIELDKREHETDRLQRDVRLQLFAIERDLPPIDVIFLYKIIEWIGELADIAQQVGHRLQLILAH